MRPLSQPFRIIDTDSYPRYDTVSDPDVNRAGWSLTVEKWTPDRRMERTRAALIASARHLFATKGFEGASLDEIADAAGYTRGAIYRHFANKEDLFFAVSDAVNTELLDTFAEELDLETSSVLTDNRQTAGTWFKALV